MNTYRIITNTLPDGSERPIMTGEMVAEAHAKARKLPPSIWTITDVIACPTDLTGTVLYEIWIRRRDQADVIIVYSKEGAAPQIGGLLERMTRPRGGLAAIWTDSKATKASMGGGYSEEALPPEWGTPAKPLVGMTEGQKRMFGSVDGGRS